jgi:FMN reductase (NADPH)
MNPTLELLAKRKSVRAYSQRPITADEKDQILRAALRAPTAGNLMLYSIIEVADQALKDRLAETCDNQPFIATAPLVLLFLADYQRWFDYFRLSRVAELCHGRGGEMRLPDQGDLLLACCDTLIAAQTAVIAAEALGIGSCYIGDIIEHYELNRQLFDLPRYVLPAALICFGYPTPEQAARQQTSRFGQEYIVHLNRYHCLEEDELQAMMGERSRKFAAAGACPDGIQNMGQYTYQRKFGADFALEMNRSVRVMIASWGSADNEL